MNDEILAVLDILESIWFLTFQLEDALPRLKALRSQLDGLTAANKSAVLEDFRREAQKLRDYYGAIPTDQQLVEFVRFIRRQHGIIFLSKARIDRELFSHYERVVPDWTEERQHASVLFDGQEIRNTFRIYTLEQSTFADVKYLLRRCREIHGGVVMCPHSLYQSECEFPGFLVFKRG